MKNTTKTGGKVEQRDPEAGKSLTIDGEFCTITRREWEKEESPKEIEENGEIRASFVITRYKCLFDIQKPNGETVRLVVAPPWLNDSARMNPLKIDSFEAVEYKNGFGETGKLNAFVLFAEHATPRRCLVELLPKSFQT